MMTTSSAPAQPRGLNLTNTPFSSFVDIDAERRALYNKFGRTYLLGARLSYSEREREEGSPHPRARTAAWLSSPLHLHAEAPRHVAAAEAQLRQELEAEVARSCTAAIPLEVETQKRSRLDATKCRSSSTCMRRQTTTTRSPRTSGCARSARPAQLAACQYRTCRLLCSAYQPSGSQGACAYSDGLCLARGIEGPYRGARRWRAEQSYSVTQFIRC